MIMLSLAQQVQLITTRARDVESKWADHWANKPHSLLNPDYDRMMEEKTDIDLSELERDDDC